VGEHVAFCELEEFVELRDPVDHVHRPPVECLDLCEVEVGHHDLVERVQLVDVSPTRSSTIRTRGASTHRWPSGRVALSWECSRRWGTVGDAYDNAMCESFFATLECELLDRVRFRNHSEVDAALFDFIEGFYNSRRRHSALDYLSPARYERMYAPAA
jgi:transposase InsO family protein